MIEKKVVSRSTAIGLGIVCIILIAGLVGVFAYYSMQVNGSNDYRSNLETWLAGNITQLQSQRDSLQGDYNNYLASHHHTDLEYDVLVVYKDELETWLAGNVTQLQSQYNNYVSDHHYTDEQYISMNASSYDAGYTKGLNDGAGHGFTVRDPTYQEMLNFIASDQTNKNQYNASYVCWNFAGDVKNNAFKVGYRCGLVFISFPDSAHAIVCFNTIDKELIFIEPQDDSIVSVVIGQHYWDRTKYIISYNDTIVSFAIIW